MFQGSTKKWYKVVQGGGTRYKEVQGGGVTQMKGNENDGIRLKTTPTK